MAASRHPGPISKVALDFDVSVSVVQKAVDRVERAMGGPAFFVMAKKRTAKLSPDGERFLRLGNVLYQAWTATLSDDTAK